MQHLFLTVEAIHVDVPDVGDRKSEPRLRDVAVERDDLLETVLGEGLKRCI